MNLKLFRHLYVQVLIGIVLGILLGVLSPEWGAQMKPLSDVFIKLIKMLIPPIIFLSVVSGIASMHSMKAVGKIAGTAILYFLFTTTAALFIGLLVANIFQPGAGLNIDPASLDTKDVAAYLGGKTAPTGIKEYFLNIIPMTFRSAFVDGDILQVLFVALLFAAGLIMIGDKGKPISNLIKTISSVFFKMIHIVMYFAPIGAFAAMALTIGKYGIGSLLDMLGLLLCFYLTCIVFICVILGGILKYFCKINIFDLIKYIKTEIFIVLGTSSSETVLPYLMEKLEELGCEKSVVGLVIPTGYSFNLDGTAIYLTMAALFIAQATHVDLALSEQLILLVIMIISSKGAAGVVGSGFIVLASSLSAIGHVPVAGIVLILGIDRFMSEGRSMTNMIGNTIATILISKWQNAFDHKKALMVLKNPSIYN
jgi:aerobic C4-dicarboxylate transport protein